MSTLEKKGRPRAPDREQRCSLTALPQKIRTVLEEKPKRREYAELQEGQQRCPLRAPDVQGDWHGQIKDSAQNLVLDQ